MAQSEDDLFDDPTIEELDEEYGEDHRGDLPGYDLDEQQAIEELERELEDEE